MTDHITEIKIRFFNSLKRGTGEAYLIMLDNPFIDFSDLIIKGALTNYAYDQQSEGSRAKYIYRFIKKSEQKEKIVKAILTELQIKKEDYWGLDQICDLAVLFFKAGYVDAKLALYTRFELNNTKGYEFCGQDQLMEIDGLKGLLTVAETIGKTILEENNWEDSWHVDNFQKKNKSLDVYSNLKNASKRNKFINAYYKLIIENRWHLPKRGTPIKWTYPLVKEKIDTNKLRFISTQRANDLSPEEVETLANDFLNERNKLKQEQYLRFFAKRKYPFDYQPLLKIASGTNPRKTRLVEYAVEAMKFFKSKEIRQFAFEKLKTAKHPGTYSNLLVSNYQKGDYKFLSTIANKSNNYNYIHSIVFGFIDIYEANKTKECKEPLEIIYNKMNCGLHRYDIVRLLIENNVLSEKIQQELRYDSYNAIRRLSNSRVKNGS